MDTGSGLVVPNIKDVQRKSVLEIADDMVRYAKINQIKLYPIIRGPTVCLFFKFRN